MNNQGLQTSKDSSESSDHRLRALDFDFRMTISIMKLVTILKGINKGLTKTGPSGTITATIELTAEMAVAEHYFPMILIPTHKIIATSKPSTRRRDWRGK